MKYEWKKKEKELYLSKATPCIIEVPKQRFFMISGKGNPNELDFSERVGVLYSLSYAVRMMPKSGYTPKGYYEYTVYPLEGLWDMTEEGKEQNVLEKNELLYTIMIRQPEFVTDEVFERALEAVRKKKPHPFLEEVLFGEVEDGLSVQMMHTGPYDDEPESFALMKSFIKENGFEISTLVHREIYIKPKKEECSKEELRKIKTVLRYRVKNK